MADNPQGLISIRDELSGLLNLLARHDRPTDKAFYLEAANGTGSAVVDRITRGTKYVPAVCLSLFGTIQPDPISSYLAQQRDRGPGDDGFIQRFLIVAPAPEPWHGRAKPPSEAAATDYRDAITALHTTPATDLAMVSDLHIRTRTGEAVVPSTLGEPPVLHFTPEAEEHFRSWRNWLEPAIRDPNELAAIRAFRGKMRGYAPRIAAILHLLGGGKGDVPLAPLKDAIRWLDILEEHARAIYGADSPGRAGAQVLAERIRDGSLKKRTHGRSFTLREVMRLGWTRLTSRQAVADAVDLLIDAHWIIEEPTGRKGSRRFHLNPKLD